MLVGDIMRQSAKRYKDRPAFKDEEKTLTFRQAGERSNALIHALKDLGVNSGDRVSVVLSNCVEYCEILFALPKAGLTAVTLNNRLLKKELENLINNSESNTVIFDTDVEDRLEAIRPRLETVKNYIVVDRKKTSKLDALNYEKLIESHPTTEISAEVSESDVAYILYTSGTTGHPKGVMCTHRNILTNLTNMALEIQPKPTDKILNPPPLYHVAGQNQTMIFFWYGCPTITMKKFDAKNVLEIIKSERPTVCSLMPTMQNMIINHPDVGDYDLSCVELILYGASPILRSHLRKSMGIFSCKFIQCAGLTEGGTLIMLRPEDHVIDGPEEVVRKLGSGGSETKLCEVKIVDEEGHEVPPNTRGELIGRGNTVMKGYWKLPEATAEIIVDGWLHTGDICIRDEDGYVYYVDRLKDMICRGAENVYPREIEEVISTHPSVKEVAVIGVPDDRLQEEIMAVVVLKSGMPVTGEEIVTLCKENLASYKKPRYVEFIEELPKAQTGKILKRELKKQYEKRTLPPKIDI